MDPITDAADNVYSWPSVSSYPADDNPSGITYSPAIPSTSDASNFFKGAGELLGKLVNYQLQSDTIKANTQIQTAAATVQAQQAQQKLLLPNGQVNSAALTRLLLGLGLAAGVIAGAVFAVKKLA